MQIKEKVFFRIFTLKKNNQTNQATWQKGLDEKLILNLSKTRLPNFRQLKMLTKILNKKEKKFILILIIIFSICLSWLGYKFYLNNTKLVPKNGGNYIEGLVGVPKNINPLLSQYNDVDQDLTTLIFSGLMRVNQQGGLEPDLASEYQISEDKKTYTFKLKENVFWHDGEKLTAADVIFTFNSINDPDWQSLWQSSFTNVGLERIDDLTVRFVLKEPNNLFLENLTFGLIPEHLWQNIPAFNATLAELNKKPVGTGPFKFKSLTKDKSGNIRTVTLERNDKYFFKPPYLDQIIFKFYGDFDTATEALKNGNIQGLSLLPKEEMPLLEKNNNLTFYYLSLPQYTAVFFNLQNNEFLKVKAIRQALAYATDKERILNEAGERQGQLINGPILPGFVGYNPDLKNYGFDQIKAGELLDKEGWKIVKENDKDIRKKGDQTLQIKITTVDKIEYTKAAEIIKENWQAIGVQTEIEIIEKNRIAKDIIEPRNYQALIFGEIIKNDPYPFWHSSQTQSPGTNLAVWANRDVDKLLEEGRATSDFEVKNDKYKKFQTILIEESPVIFLYNPVHLYPVDKKINGLDTKIIFAPADRFANITEWYIETKREWGK